MLWLNLLILFAATLAAALFVAGPVFAAILVSEAHATRDIEGDTEC